MSTAWGTPASAPQSEPPAAGRRVARRIGRFLLQQLGRLARTAVWSLGAPVIGIGLLILLVLGVMLAGAQRQQVTPLAPSPTAPTGATPPLTRSVLADDQQAITQAEPPAPADADWNLARPYDTTPAVLLGIQSEGLALHPTRPPVDHAAQLARLLAPQIQWVSFTLTTVTHHTETTTAPGPQGQPVAVTRTVTQTTITHLAAPISIRNWDGVHQFRYQVLRVAIPHGYTEQLKVQRTQWTPQWDRLRAALRVFGPAHQALPETIAQILTFAGYSVNPGQQSQVELLHQTPVPVTPLYQDLVRWPVPGFVQVTNGYGAELAPTTGLPELHQGITIAAPAGTPVRAAIAGRVQVIPAGNTGLGLGTHIVEQQQGGLGLQIVYAHLQRTAVTNGAHVQPGQVIGWVGHSGNVPGAALTLEILDHGRFVNPLALYEHNLADTLTLSTPTIAVPGIPGGVPAGCPAPPTPAPPPAAYLPAYAQAAAAYAIPEAVLMALDMTESSFNPDAIGPLVLHATQRALGLGQFLQTTWPSYRNADPNQPVPEFNPNAANYYDPMPIPTVSRVWNPEAQIWATAAYLHALGGATDMATALYHYSGDDPCYAARVLTWADQFYITWAGAAPRPALGG